MKRKSEPGDGKLHPHLMTYVGYCLHKVGLRLRAQIDKKIAGLGLVSPQYGMLMILKSEGIMTQVELGEYMAMDKATMVRMLDGLEEKGYLNRAPSREDRRAKLLELTEKGRKIIAVLEKSRSEVEREFLKPISAAEKAQLKAILVKLL